MPWKPRELFAAHRLEHSPSSLSLEHRQAHRISRGWLAVQRKDRSGTAMNQFHHQHSQIEQQILEVNPILEGIHEFVLEKSINTHF